MAPYLIEYLYDRPPERRQAANTEHVAHLRRLALDGVVLAAGAIRDNGRGFVLARWHEAVAHTAPATS